MHAIEEQSGARHWHNYSNVADLSYAIPTTQAWLEVLYCTRKNSFHGWKMYASNRVSSGSCCHRIYNKPVNMLWEWTARDAVPVEVKAFLPSTSAIKITLGQGVQMITFVNTVPIDANRATAKKCRVCYKVP
eukprot:1140710-Pelagomonas_calceolata.AAC.2